MKSLDEQLKALEHRLGKMTEDELVAKLTSYRKDCADEPVSFWEFIGEDPKELIMSRKVTAIDRRARILDRLKDLDDASKSLSSVADAFYKLELVKLESDALEEKLKAQGTQTTYHFNIKSAVMDKCAVASVFDINQTLDDAGYFAQRLDAYDYTEPLYESLTIRHEPEQ